MEFIEKLLLLFRERYRSFNDNSHVQITAHSAAQAGDAFTFEAQYLSVAHSRFYAYLYRASVKVEDALRALISF